MKPGLITLHCSATKNADDCPASVIKTWHLNRGFHDIGYHMVIQPDGTVENGRPLNKVGAHVEKSNLIGEKINIGICLVGTDRFTQYQFYALRYKLDSLFLIYDIEPWEIYGHYEFDTAKDQGKTCPNMRMARIQYWYSTQIYAAIRDYTYKTKGLIRIPC